MIMIIKRDMISTLPIEKRDAILKEFDKIFPKGMKWNGANIKRCKSFDLVSIFTHLNLPPSYDTRKASCESPHLALFYAMYVDKCPRDDTRMAASKRCGYAYLYAKFVDKEPNDITRVGACQTPLYSYFYAMYVDKFPRDDTSEMAHKDPELGRIYDRMLKGENNEG